MTEEQQSKTCPKCMNLMADGFQFCGKCGADLSKTDMGAKHWLIRLLNAEGEIEDTAAIMPGTQVIGSNTDADILIEDDRAVSPRHVLVRLQDSDLSLEDQGSRNGLFKPLEQSEPIGHNDLIRAGGQLFRFQLIERLGVEPVVALPHPAFGPSQPAWGRLLRYNRHGQVSATRLLESATFSVGRRNGDWSLKRARTMSGEHFEMQRDDEGKVSIQDLNSRNGTFVEIRGAASANDGDRFLIGDRMVSVSQVSLKEYHGAFGTADDIEIHDAETVDASEVNVDETLVAIPEDVIEAALEDSIPPVVAEEGDVEAQPAIAKESVEFEPFDEAGESDEVAADKAPETEAVEEAPETEAVEEAPETEAVEEAPEAEAVEEAPETEAVEEAPEAEAVEEAPEAEAVEEAPEAEVAEEAPETAEALEAPTTDNEADADRETVAVEQAQEAVDEHATEIDDEGPGDWAKAALMDFQDNDES